MPYYCLLYLSVSSREMFLTVDSFHSILEFTAGMILGTIVGILGIPIKFNPPSPRDRKSVV